VILVVRVVRPWDVASVWEDGCYRDSELDCAVETESFGARLVVDAEEDGSCVWRDADFDGREWVCCVAPGAEFENSGRCEEGPDSEAKLDGQEGEEMESRMVRRR